MTETRKKSEKKTKYLVDYDLPKRSAARSQFYRDLKKIHVTKSSKSVVVTTDLAKAMTVHRKAAAIGRSSLYKVKQKKRKK